MVMTTHPGNNQLLKLLRPARGWFLILMGLTLSFPTLWLTVRTAESCSSRLQLAETASGDYLGAALCDFSGKQGRPAQPPPPITIAHSFSLALQRQASPAAEWIGVNLGLRSANLLHPFLPRPPPHS